MGETARIIAAVAAAIGLSACAATGPGTLDERLPVALSYRVPAGEPAPSARMRSLAEAVRSGYVRVLIIADTDASETLSGVAESGTVNGASGTVIDSVGHVVTAAHIALGTRYRAEITTVDGRVHPARIVDVDPARELALLEMKAPPPLEAPRFADPSRLRVGDRVLAIGTPVNKKGVVSVGEVARTRYARRIQYGRFGYDDAIVLRMAVQPGHSGGPVFNLDGELVGIIGSFALPKPGRRSGPAPEVAFAIPASAIAAYVDEVLGRRR